MAEQVIAVRHQPVNFAGIVVNHFIFIQFHNNDARFEVKAEAQSSVQHTHMQQL
jgi:hypothetical protein